MQSASPVWQREDTKRHRPSTQHRFPVHSPEPAITHTIWRPRDCIPQVEIKRRPYGIMPHRNFVSLHQAAIKLTKATPELLQDRLQPPVQRSPTSTCNKLPHYTVYNPAALIESSHYNHYIYHVTRQKPKIYRTREDSWRQLVPTGSTHRGRSLHFNKHTFQLEIHHHLHSILIQNHMLIPQHNETPTTKALAEHMSPIEDCRLQPAVHRSTILRGKLSESRLAAATLTTTPETRRKYKGINTQSENMPTIYSSLEETERLQSCSKYGTMFNYVTDTSCSPYSQSHHALHIDKSRLHMEDH